MQIYFLLFSFVDHKTHMFQFFKGWFILLLKTSNVCKLYQYYVSFLDEAEGRLDESDMEMDTD